MRYDVGCGLCAVRGGMECGVEVMQASTGSAAGRALLQTELRRQYGAVQGSLRSRLFAGTEMFDVATHLRGRLGALCRYSLVLIFFLIILACHLHVLHEQAPLLDGNPPVAVVIEFR